MTGEFVTDRHLGGYFAGGDPSCMYPDLWAWLVDVQGVRSVLDVGCGDGAALDVFAGLGCEVVGIDGMPNNVSHIIQHDFTEGPCRMPVDRMVESLDHEAKLVSVGWEQRQFDLVWSCEFVEHVEAQYVPNFLWSFQQAPLVLMTHAGPGQPGWHHVNCQDDLYWQGVLASVGYRMDEELTRDTRALAAANTDPNNHYVRSGLAFRREETT